MIIQILARVSGMFSNHDQLEERECIVWMRILVRVKLQGLNFHTHKDLYQSLTVASEYSIENRRTLEERECIVWMRILVRVKVQGLKFHTHKDLNQNPSPLIQSIQLI